MLKISEPEKSYCSFLPPPPSPPPKKKKNKIFLTHLSGKNEQQFSGFLKPLHIYFFPTIGDMIVLSKPFHVIFILYFIYT